jgi:hypothetical protein
MTKNNRQSATADLRQIIESAGRLGIEMDEAEAIQWLTAMASWQAGEQIVIDDERGVFGHTVSLLDFDPAELVYYREMGQLVEFVDLPGQVETALALSGSAAQSKIQTYPGDCDFFERVNIHAPTREEACDILAAMMRKKALSTLIGPTYRLLEIKFSSYPEDLIVNGVLHKAGSPIAWTPASIQSGGIYGLRPDGAEAAITWDEVKGEPGWCKLDWIVGDPVHSRIANISNMLDVTWEAPDGTITPLDGYLDPYYQEVYLEAESIPLFSKLVQQLSSDALSSYLNHLEKEVYKYVARDPRNYGKAAKRMYNVFRLNGQYGEAAFLRELFDEPATMLYQVWSLIRTLDEAAAPGGQIDVEMMLAQIDQMILGVVSSLEGDAEREIVGSLLRLRNLIAKGEDCNLRTAEAEAAREHLIEEVNRFFYDRLVVVPSIRTYIEQCQNAA